MSTQQPVITIQNIKDRLDDWAQLNFYRESNKVLLPAALDEKRVVFLGDSIFHFWDDPKFGGFFSGKPYINRGISAQTTSQMLLRLRADVIALKPKVLVVLAGTHDIAGNTGPMTQAETEDTISSIAELAQLHAIKVIIASLLPTSNYHFIGKDKRGPQTKRRPLERIRALNTWIQEYCTAHNYLYLDYFSAMVDSHGMLKKELSDDDLHPNTTGYAIMAPLTEHAIEKALA